MVLNQGEAAASGIDGQWIEGAAGERMEAASKG
jgi:hypothetical protein